MTAQPPAADDPLTAALEAEVVRVRGVQEPGRKLDLAVTGVETLDRYRREVQALRADAARALLDLEVPFTRVARRAGYSDPQGLKWLLERNPAATGEEPAGDGNHN